MNSIEKKNAARLNTLPHQKEGLKVGGTRVDLNLFVEEMGKTIITALEGASPDICSKVAAGDVAELKVDDDGIVAETSRGVRLGTLEAKLARRLIKFMRGGNRYQGGVTACDGSTVKLIVRETYQDPKFAGKPSFPMRRKREVEFRPYTKESLLSREVEVFAGEDDDEEPLVEAAVSDDLEEGMHAVEDEAEPVAFGEDADADTEAGEEDDSNGIAGGREGQGVGAGATALVRRSRALDGRGPVPPAPRDLPGGRRACRSAGHRGRRRGDRARGPVPAGERGAALPGRRRPRRVLPRNHGRGQAARRSQSRRPRLAGSQGFRGSRIAAREDATAFGRTRAPAALPGSSRRP